MANIISVLVGFLSLISVAIAFLPFFGWLNWIIIPLPVIGLAIGCLSQKTSGRRINILAILLGFFRLVIGGGIF